GQEQLDAAIAQAQAAGMYDAAAEQFAQQQAAIDAGAAELEAGKQELAIQEQALALGTELAGYAQEIRTVSQDGSTALAALTFVEQAYALTPEDKQAVIETISAMPIEGVTADFSAELTTDVSGVLGIGEVAGVLIAFLVLTIMMRAALP